MNKDSIKKMADKSIGAIAAGIAGAYYLYGSKDGEAKRKQIAAWSLKMKADMLDGIEKLKTVSEPTYKDLVKKVSAKYAKVDKGELKKVVDEIHSTWNKMKSEVKAEIAKKDAIIKKEGSFSGKVKKAASKAMTNVKAKVNAKRNAVKSVKVKATPEKTVEVKVENTDK